MIKIENVEISGWESAIRGMRNPLNSWERSDSKFTSIKAKVGDNDRNLMNGLAVAGAVHAKYRRFIVVTCDIVAPLYWWKEYDTYKVGTVANSCSTMHKITDKPFEMSDFSFERCVDTDDCKGVVDDLEWLRDKYNNYDDYSDWCWDKGVDPEPRGNFWYSIIQMLPSGYNQRRTVMLNYEVLANIYRYRKTHKLDEWVEFCEWIKNLPYSEVITCE